ncbi:hypothetical protein HBH51_095240 [Parastagonospora nodorum]|nr:hypothetical protein HBH51_095240 [Parastagonospora nodorum]
MIQRIKILIPTQMRHEHYSCLLRTPSTHHLQPFYLCDSSMSEEEWESGAGGGHGGAGQDSGELEGARRGVNVGSGFVEGVRHCRVKGPKGKADDPKSCTGTGVIVVKES